MLDYLQHAECIKEKSTTEVYCGSHYSRYVTMIMTRSLYFLMFQARGYGQGSHTLDTEGAVLLPQSLQGRIIKKEETGLIFHIFQDCVLHETRACGGSGQMSAQDFARAMLDKSLGFLLKQCQVTRKKLFGKQNCIQWFSGLRTKQV